MSQSDEIEWTGINKSWCIGVLLVHIFVFVFMIIGFSRFKNVLAIMILGITISCCVPLYIFNFFMSAKYAVPENIWSDYGVLTDHKVRKKETNSRHCFIGIVTTNIKNFDICRNLNNKSFT